MVPEAEDVALEELTILEEEAGIPELVPPPIVALELITLLLENGTGTRDELACLLELAVLLEDTMFEELSLAEELATLLELGEAEELAPSSTAEELGVADELSGEGELGSAALELGEPLEIGILELEATLLELPGPLEDTLQGVGLAPRYAGVSQPVAVSTTWNVGTSDSLMFMMLYPFPATVPEPERIVVCQVGEALVIIISYNPPEQAGNSKLGLNPATVFTV